MLKGVDIRRHDIPVFIGLDLTSLYHRFYSKKYSLLQDDFVFDWIYDVIPCA